MSQKAIRTTAEAMGRPILVEVVGDRLEMWRMGERESERRSVSIESIYRDAVATGAPRNIITPKTSNSIVAFYVGWKRGRSYWKRTDTGEELTEGQLRRASRLEGRPFLPLYGMPPERLYKANGGAA
ncbi:MAG: hypothetical protein ABFD89_22160 [Bryobacteraceae bacterium]